MPRIAKPPTFEIVHCPHCGKQHVDQNTDDFPYAEKNHSQHLCLKEDDGYGRGCGRLFFGAYAIGVKELPKACLTNDCYRQGMRHAPPCVTTADAPLFKTR